MTPQLHIQSCEHLRLKPQFALQCLSSFFILEKDGEEKGRKGEGEREGKTKEKSF